MQFKPDKMWIRIKKEGSPTYFMAKVLDCSLKVSEFEHLSGYYVNFQTNTFEKGMKPLISPAMS